MAAPELVSLDLRHPIWDRFFTVAPLVVVGTREADGGHDLAPKHLALPLGWSNRFGFFCTEAHATLRNARRTGVFTVSFPGPDQVLLTSLAAAPRTGDDAKPALQALAVLPAREVDGVLLEEAWLHLECELERVIDGFDENALVAGRIVAAHARPEVLRADDRDDGDLIAKVPQLAYLYPGRFARIADSYSFPFHEGFSR